MRRAVDANDNQMQLTPDASLFVQVAIFIVLWFSLKRLLFDPVLAVLDARRERTVGALAQSEHARAGAEAARDEYEQALRDTRVQLALEADQARKKAQDAHAKALTDARAAANEELASFRAALSRQVDEARATLAGEARAIAGEMLARVTGRASS